ncbi:MAG: ABC transporter ATP-binding protein, partial [Clostridia bacterium]|nr:ABC transporter ATP-binding protein [Clostridia bacterium]
MSRILGMYKPYRRTIFFALALDVVCIITRLIVPRLTATVVNDVITAGKYDILIPLCMAILGLTMVRSISNYVRAMSFQRVSQNIAYDLRTGLYDHLQGMPWEFYDKNRVGEIMSRMTGDMNNVRNFLCNTTFSIFTNLLCFVGSFVFMMFMSWQVTLMVLVMAPVIAAVAWKFNRHIRPIFREVREQNAVLNTRTQEDLTGMHVVKAFAREDYEEKRFNAENDKLLKHNLHASFTWSNYM